MRVPTSARRSLAACGAVALLAGSQAQAAERMRPPPARAALASVAATLGGAMRHAGPRAGALVVDTASGRTVFATRADVARNPASVEKLYTTSTALERFGPGAQLDTAVLASAPPDAGVIRGDLYLRGGGDPTFGDERFVHSAYGTGATVGELARALVDRIGLVRVEGSIVGDESLFDALRGEPASGFRFDSDLTGVLSALAFDRGRSGGVGSPAAFAASQLAAALRQDGVVVKGPARAGAAPAQAVLQVAIPSPSMRTLARLTNQPSDNFFAEMLVKDLGAHYGDGGTTVAGVRVVRRWLKSLSISPRIVDGSGLSRSDLTSPNEVVALLRHMQPGASAAADALRASLPVAGRSGTLRHRMRNSPAAGSCAAKTGTLRGVSALAGWCHDRYAFAFLMNGIGTGKAHVLQDRMTASIATLTP